MANITFIGLGRMGVGMAQRLLAAGHRLRVYNRTASRARSLVEQGATLCPSPKEAAQGAELIFSMVSDDAASREVWLGAAGVFGGEPPAGTLVIECSTLSHDWVLELAAEARRRSLSYIDCPVTGLPDMAAAGAEVSDDRLRPERPGRFWIHSRIFQVDVTREHSTIGPHSRRETG